MVYQVQVKKGQKEPTLKWVHRNQIKPHKNPMVIKNRKTLKHLGVPVVRVRINTKIVIACVVSFVEINQISSTPVQNP